MRGILVLDTLAVVEEWPHRKDLGLGWDGLLFIELALFHRCGRDQNEIG